MLGSQNGRVWCRLQLTAGMGMKEREENRMPLYSQQLRLGLCLFTGMAVKVPCISWATAAYHMHPIPQDCLVQEGRSRQRGARYIPSRSGSNYIFIQSGSSQVSMPQLSRS